MAHSRVRRQRSIRRHALIPIVAGLALVPLLAPVGQAADQPIHVVTPAGITVDGNVTDWDPAADAFAPLYENGDATKPVLAQSLARFDCGTNTLYLLVRTAPTFYLVPSPDDSFVKSGDTVLVDVASGNDGIPPDVAGVPFQTAAAAASG